MATGALDEKRMQWGQIMIELKPGAGMVVASDVQNTLSAVDGAILNGARLCASFIEATQNSNLPVSHSQKVIKSITAGLSAVADGRAEIVEAVRHLTAIKDRSNLVTENYGCPTPWDAVFAPLAEAGVPQTT